MITSSWVPSERRVLIFLVFIPTGRVCIDFEDEHKRFCPSVSEYWSFTSWLSSASSTRGSRIAIDETSCTDPPEVLRDRLGVPGPGLVRPDLEDFLGVEGFPWLGLLLTSINIVSSGMSLEGVLDLSDSRLLRLVGVCKWFIPDMDVGLTERDLVTAKYTKYD